MPFSSRPTATSLRLARGTRSAPAASLAQREHQRSARNLRHTQTCTPCCVVTNSVRVFADGGARRR
jgi:hypothetical protein